MVSNGDLSPPVPPNVGEESECTDPPISYRKDYGCHSNTSTVLRYCKDRGVTSPNLTDVVDELSRCINSGIKTHLWRGA